RVYLVDFGAVQNSAAVEGVTFTVVGTSGYAPLEQFWGQAVAASDLYALGASLIHLLTGISPADLPQRELRIQFRDKVRINPQFLNWIEALSEPDLTLRFQTASQAINALKGNCFIPIHPDKIKHSDIKKIKHSDIIQRPPDTKIKIKKYANKIIINIPAKQTFLQNNIIAFLSKIIPIVGWLLLLIPLSLAMSLIEVRIFLTIPEVWSEFRITYNGELIVAIWVLLLFAILAIPCLYFKFSKYILTVVLNILNDIQSRNGIDYKYLIECHREKMFFCCQYISKYKKFYFYKNNIPKSTIKEVGIDALVNQVYMKIKYRNLRTENLTINCLNINECKWLKKTLEKWLN
ncbi:MAG: hypothetical protein RLP12_04295, partial [Ekhidna sp.]